MQLRESPHKQYMTFNFGNTYAGQPYVTIEFEFVGRYSISYSGSNGSFAQIDNICFYDLTPCTNYDVIANLDNQIVLCWRI